MSRERRRQRLAHFLGTHLHRDQTEAAFWALFTVHADGAAAVTMTESTGRAALDALALDALALDAARRWRFAPATQDGVPVESDLRPEVKFDTTLPTSRRITRKDARP